jgi:hypothetical protein
VILTTTQAWTAFSNSSFLHVPTRSLTGVGSAVAVFDFDPARLGQRNCGRLAQRDFAHVAGRIGSDISGSIASGKRARNRPHIPLDTPAVLRYI